MIDRLAIFFIASNFAREQNSPQNFSNMMFRMREATARLAVLRFLVCDAYIPRLWLSVKVDVHINNNGFVGRPHPSNGHAARSELAREPSEHAYEQICVRQEETGSVNSSSRKKPADNASDSR